MKIQCNLQNKTSIVQMLKRTDKKFEITVINMLEILMQKVDKNARIDNFSRELEIMKIIKNDINQKSNKINKECL